jgi:hypothetical protein
MAKPGEERVVLRRPEDVEPPYDLSPYEDLQEARGPSVFVDDLKCRFMEVIGSFGTPRPVLGVLVLGFKENKQLTMRCE